MYQVFFGLEMNVQSSSESLFSTEHIQKQVVPLKISEVYLSVDIKYVSVTTKGSTWKINSEILGPVGFSDSLGPWSHGSFKARFDTAWAHYIYMDKSESFQNHAYTWVRHSNTQYENIVQRRQLQQLNKVCCPAQQNTPPVSYTHLTLPTTAEV